MSIAEVPTKARKYPFSQTDGLKLDPLYARLREQEPLSRVQLAYGEEAWLATRYEDVKVVLGDARFSRAAAVGRDEPRSMPRSPDQGMLHMDPPDHTRLRTLVAKAFTARRVEELRARTQEIADRLVDDMVAPGAPADFVAGYAKPLPTTVICELLGIPEGDREQFSVWAEAIISTTSLTMTQVQTYLDNMRAYMSGQIALRRREPTDDLLNAMVCARDERQDRLTEQELIDLAFGLLAAGQETTVTQLPNFLYVLLTNVERWRELGADPGLVPAAVEELMRYVPLGVAAAFPRYAKEDVELGGVLVRAGEPVLPAVHSANRDPAAFPDPDRIDFHRDSRLHFGFGHGVHHCLGAPLARMELQVGIGTLVRRLPAMELAVPEDTVRWHNGRLVRGLISLPIRW